MFVFISTSTCIIEPNGGPAAYHERIVEAGRLGTLCSLLVALEHDAVEIGELFPVVFQMCHGARVYLAGEQRVRAGRGFCLVLREHVVLQSSFYVFQVNKKIYSFNSKIASNVFEKCR